MSLAIDNLRRQIAATATFIAWTSSANAAAALARVHYEQLTPPDGGVTDTEQTYSLTEKQALRPYALVWMIPDGGFTSDRNTAGSAASDYNDSGALGVEFYANVDPLIASDPPEISRLFLNKVGNIIEEMKALFGGDGYLCIERFMVEYGPARGSADELTAEGDYMAIRLRIEWGTGR